MPDRLLRTFLLALSFVLACQHVANADDVPFRRRRRTGITPNRIAADRVDPADWPAEPPSPDAVDPVRFAEALESLCGWMPRDRPLRWARYVLEPAREFDIDPFLLGALVHRMGRCVEDADALSGYGLTLIPARMYFRNLRDGTYRFWQQREGEWVEQTLELDRYPFAGIRLKRARENLYFAAGLLAAWRAQHESVDQAFEQEDHRHFVSHFVWGDRVPSDRAEDRVFLDRRRLLFYYGAIDRAEPLSFRGLTVASPLDGSPRVISSFIGADREGGERHHRGIDIEADFREPVRAVADGRVSFAGVDLPGSQHHRNVDPDDYDEVPRSRLAAGGRFVCIVHDTPEQGWLRSCYMHLEDVFVKYGDEVKRGDRIGTVGRTGMDESAAHLHLELHDSDGLVDPSEVLRGPLVGRRVVLE